MEHTFHHNEGCAFYGSTTTSASQRQTRPTCSHLRSLSDDRDCLQIVNECYYPIYGFDFGASSSVSDAASTNQHVPGELGYRRLHWSQQALNNDLSVSGQMHSLESLVPGPPEQSTLESSPDQTFMLGSLGNSQTWRRSGHQENTLNGFPSLDTQCLHHRDPTNPLGCQQEGWFTFDLSNHLISSSTHEASFEKRALAMANTQGQYQLQDLASFSDITSQPSSNRCTSWSNTREPLHQTAQLSGDISGSTSAQATPPPPPDSSEDSALIPYQQRTRSSDDLYTPKWVRGTGTNREGWCDLCQPGRWLVLKNSAYWYDKTFTHGVSHHTGRRFPDPVMVRPGSRAKNRRRALTTGDLGYCMQFDVSASEKTGGQERDRNTRQGLCGACHQWITLGAGRKCRGYGLNWYRHAYKCQTRTRSFDNDQTSIPSRPTSLPVTIIDWKPNLEELDDPTVHTF